MTTNRASACARAPAAPAVVYAALTMLSRKQSTRKQWPRRRRKRRSGCVKQRAHDRRPTAPSCAPRPSRRAAALCRPQPTLLTMRSTLPTRKLRVPVKMRMARSRSGSRRDRTKWSSTELVLGSSLWIQTLVCKWRMAAARHHHRRKRHPAGIRSTRPHISSIPLPSRRGGRTTMSTARGLAAPAPPPARANPIDGRTASRRKSAACVAAGC